MSLPRKYAGKPVLRFLEDNEQGCHQRLVVQSRGRISYGKLVCSLQNQNGDMCYIISFPLHFLPCYLQAI